MDIYVGNLPYSATEDELQQAFEQFGPVDTVKIVKDFETGRSKGFAFVTMSGNEDAEKAIEEMDGASLGGRPLKVNAARPRENRGPRPGGGGGFKPRGGGGGGRGGYQGGNRGGGSRGGYDRGDRGSRDRY